MSKFSSLLCLAVLAVSAAITVPAKAEIKTVTKLAPGTAVTTTAPNTTNSAAKATTSTLTTTTATPATDTTRPPPADPEQVRKDVEKQRAAALAKMKVEGEKHRAEMEAEMKKHQAEIASSRKGGTSSSSSSSSSGFSFPKLINGN